MKKKVILAGLLSLYMQSVKSMTKDSINQKQTLKKTEIEILYSHYRQEGNNSAVTGGIGTEKLTVYAPGFNLKRSKGNQILTIKGGTDIISSASTDKIDFVKSSASILDARTYTNIGLSKLFPAKKISLGIGSGFSIESDYFSLPFSLSAVKTSKNKSRQMGIDLQMFFDDLRWGRLNPGYYSPQYLIYPAELRYNDWFQSKKRQSFNLKFSLTQIINKRNIIGIYPEYSIQRGLLSTPFHRVYFQDSTVMVETLPSIRNKFGLAIKWNTFIGSRTALKNTLNFYSDDFGIKGLAAESEAAVKLNGKWTLLPFIRIYTQKASPYFAGYRMHQIGEMYFTSDYDLSRFNTFKTGLGFKYAPISALGKHFYWNEISLRYAYFQRNTNLHAHILTCMINFSHQKKK